MFSYRIGTVLIPIRYGQIRIIYLSLRIFHPYRFLFFFYHYQSFFIHTTYFTYLADLPGPVNNTRTDTDITDNIRIVTDRTDKYGSPIRSIRSIRKC